MSLDYDFQERMDAGRQVAMDRRNRGQAAGTPAKGWNVKRAPIEDTAENRLYAELADMRRDLREAHNEIARYQSGMVDDVADFGAEFDELVGRRLAPPALSPRGSTTPARTRGAVTMTTKQYLAALKKLGLSPASKATADALGLSVRQCQRVAAGQPVPETLAKLLTMYLEHGLPSAT
jgi:hypothetical protein